MHSSQIEQRPARPRLSLRDPSVEALVREIGAEGRELDQVRAFARQVCRDRNEWSIRNGGSLAHRRITRADAERELKRALAALAAGGADD